MDTNLIEALKLSDYTRDLRRDFHRHPELGFQEFRTAGIVARELNELGLIVNTGVAETGIISLLEGGRSGPVVLVRFDMDALPIIEETNAEYASQNPGVMHACGHDGHIAIGLTVARLLYSHRKELAGTVKFIFQPAEEGLGGAKRMVAEGILGNPKPDIALSLHLWNEKPVGWLGITPGPVMSASDTFYVKIAGKGGHGAAPHRTLDPVYTSAQIITALQSIVSRHIAPLDAAVVSVTSVHGGEAFNVIPSVVELKGTIRTFEPTIREHVLERFRKVVTSVAQTYGCRVEIELKQITPASINDVSITKRVKDVAESLLPQTSVDTAFRTMGSEDMAYIMKDIPGCYFFIGSANPKNGLDVGHHHPCFDFDETALPQASALMAAVISSFLE